VKAKGTRVIIKTFFRGSVRPNGPDKKRLKRVWKGDKFRAIAGLWGNGAGGGERKRRNEKTTVVQRKVKKKTTKNGYPFSQRRRNKSRGKKNLPKTDGSRQKEWERGKRREKKLEERYLGARCVNQGLKAKETHKEHQERQKKKKNGSNDGTQG